MNEVKLPAMSQSVYDRVRWMVEILLPATASLYYGLSMIWGLPGGDNVVGTIALITTFLGLAVGVNRRKFNAVNPAGVGAMVVKVDREGIPTVALELDKTPEELSQLQSIRFDVRRESV